MEFCVFIIEKMGKGLEKRNIKIEFVLLKWCSAFDFTVLI